LPFVVKRFHAPDVVAGAALSLTALCAALSSPLWGAFSDRRGRRHALLGSQCFSLAGYLLLATAGNLTVLFVSRAIEGLGGGNLGVVSAFIADETTPAERPQALAFSTAAFGAGFIVGPIFSGGLSHYGFALPFLFAAALQLACLLLTALWLPESHRPLPSEGRTGRDLRAAFGRPGVRSVLARRFLYIFAFTYFFASFSLFASDVLRAGPEVSSLLLAIAGGVGALTQIVAAGRLVGRYGLQRTSLFAFATGIAGYAVLGFVHTIAAFVVAIVLWALGGSLLRPLLEARVAELAPEGERGALLGLGDALDNLSMIVAPPVGAAIVGAAPGLVGLLPACALACGFVLTARDAPRATATL
jgi:MFS family permease